VKKQLQSSKIERQDIAQLWGVNLGCSDLSGQKTVKQSDWEEQLCLPRRTVSRNVNPHVQ